MQSTERQKAGKAIFEETGAGIGRLVAEKNVKYGDSFYKSGDVLRLLYPDGIRPNQYDDMLAITRVLDKIFRIATDKDAFGESPWSDICGYAILKAAESPEKNLKNLFKMRTQIWKKLMG